VEEKTVDTNNPPWAEGWEDHIRTAARRLGYRSLLELMRAHYAEPYGKVYRLLCSALGFRFPIMQLHKLHMLDAIEDGTVREAAKDSFARAFQEHVPAGWNKGKNAREARARAFSEWNLPFAGAQDWEHVRRCADSVWAQLNLMQPPDDWCPSSPDDPILDEAFTQAWPHAR
jgi:hypothetical protein